MKYIGFLFLVIFSFVPLSSAGIITLEFEGELLADGEPFNGTGHFKFRITDSVGRMLWAHKMVSAKGGYKDVGHLELEVVEGRYSVSLGDADEGMPQLSTEYLRRISDPHLEVWFSGGLDEFEQVGAYAVSVDPKFDLPADPLILRKLLIEERKENQTLKRQIKLERLNRVRAESRVAAAPPSKKTKGVRGPKFQVRMNTSRPEVLGSPDAPVVMMEFTDLQCPICKAFHDGPFEQIKESYVDSGQVLYINAHLPLPGHPQAVQAAQAVSCAGEQGQFWAMRDLLFSNQHDLSGEAIEAYANELGLEWDLFNDCQKQPSIVLEIDKQLQFARRMGIKATPTFVVGVLRDGQLEGDVIVGSHPFDFFAKKIEALLESAGNEVDEDVE